MKYTKTSWNSIKISDCCSFIRGVTYSKNNEVDSNGFCILRANNISITNRINFNDIKLISNNVVINEEKRLRKNDILFCVYSGSVEHVGKVGFINADTEFFAGGFMGILRPMQNVINAYYLYNVLISSLFEDLKKTQRAGTNIQSLKFSDFESYKIPLPPLKEQKQIASLFQYIVTAMEKMEMQEKNLFNLKNKLLGDLFNDKQQFGNHLVAKDFETVRFDKVAINISERVEPKKTELTTYVGLEHLDADNLKIERTGTPDDVIGTKLKIYKGDIIFGKRRAYLRKVAVSHFDGIASAHSMILRANENYIEKDFLPYFMQSDTFMSRAVQISEGSLSPTIKNKTLAQQEFTLPKKEKQKELVTIFKQFDLTMEQLKQQKKTLKNLKEKLLEEILG